MKEIIDLEGKEYLAKTYKLAKAYKQCIVDTGAVTALFVALDEGEELPPTRKLAAAMSRALSDDDFMAFLRSLM